MNYLPIVFFTKLLTTPTHNLCPNDVVLCLVPEKLAFPYTFSRQNLAVYLGITPVPHFCDCSVLLYPTVLHEYIDLRVSKDIFVTLSS